MRSIFHLLAASWLVIWGTAFAAGAGAKPYLRMAVDLNGDGKAEVVTLSLSGMGTFRHYTVRSGSSKYTNRFFAEDGELPEVSLLRLYGERGKRLLLVMAPDAAACNYELFSYVGGKLVHLLSSATPTCDAPSINDRQVTVLEWQGFWKRPLTYTLNGQATKLTLTHPARIPMNIVGYAVQLSAMQPANCASSSIPDGAYVVVSEYDPAHKRYLVKSRGNACGWVAEKDIHAVGGLPWGG